MDQATRATRSRPRLLVLLALMATFFLAHGMQCAAADLHPAGSPAHVGIGESDHTAAKPSPVPPHPHDAGGHTLMVCFAVLAAGAAVLFGARLRKWLATIPEVPQRVHVPGCGNPRRWHPPTVPLVCLCVSRT